MMSDFAAQGCQLQVLVEVFFNDLDSSGYYEFFVRKRYFWTKTKN